MSAIIHIQERRILPSSQMLAAKLCHLCHLYGQYTAVRFMRNLGIPLEDTLLLLGYKVREWN